jgi:hypothetical protein
VPVKFLTEMSESTAGGNRLSFAVEWDVRKSFFGRFRTVGSLNKGEGFSDPGLFDK